MNLIKIKIYKIFFYLLILLIAISIKPLVGFIIDARDCKYELEMRIKSEQVNKELIENNKNYVKKIKNNLSNNNIEYRQRLLEQVNPSE
jgi:hypothetical protein